jgi:catalase (peroxidase I)
MCAAYPAIVTEFNALITGKDAVYLSALYGGAVRLAFHDAGEVDVRTTDLAGPDGCLSSSADNAGIVEPASVVVSILEPLWQQYCDQISRADFWALMGKLCVEAADPTRTISIPFYYGRTDSVGACEAGAGRLPGAEGGYASVKQVFVTQMGMTMSDAGEDSSAQIISQLQAMI